MCYHVQCVLSSKTQDPMLSHNIPNIPINKMAMNIAEHSGISYSVIFDFYSM